MSNDITITGNLTSAPALRFTQNGRAVFNARIADTPRRQNPDTGEWEDAGPTLFLNIELWGPEAEAVSEIIGDRERGRLTAWGTLALEQYTTKDGEEREGLRIKAQAVKYHPPRQHDQQGHSTQQARPAKGRPAKNSWGSTSDPWAAEGSSFPDEPPF